MRRDVFQAIADPTRRAIINRIAHNPLNINAVSEQFDVSRTAVYKHIKILTECGLIVIRQQGRERFCEARLGQLSEVSDWVEQYRQLWSRRFDALDDYLRVLQARDTAQPAVANPDPKNTPAKIEVASATKKNAPAKIKVSSSTRKIVTANKKVGSADKKIAFVNKEIAAKKSGSKKIAGKKKESSVKESVKRTSGKRLS